MAEISEYFWSGNRIKHKKVKIIGIDARFYGEAGPGRYVKNIIKHLEKVDRRHKYKIFLRKKAFSQYNPENSNFEKVLADFKWYSFEEQFRFLKVLIKEKLNLLYIPHFNIPVLYPKAMVTAIPDIIMHTFSTEKGTTLPKTYFKIKKVVYWWVVLWALLRSKKIIVPSNSTLEDFHKVYPFIHRKKFLVSYEGIDPDIEEPKDNSILKSLKEEFGFKSPYLLYVGSMYEHKNIDRLIRAFSMFKTIHSKEYQLVVVGKKDNFSMEIKKMINELNLNDYVKMPGEKRFINDSEVAAFMAGADLYVFPSLKEGFSLTPLEAIKMGAVCLVSDILTHREIYGNHVAYFNPYDLSDIASKINKVLTNEELKNNLKKHSDIILKKYSWDTTAKETYGIFNQILYS
ncbi:hypothetical protein A3F07_00970 [candidate division WWE3 bacterium RIFCSPHIGHO2_12_FULL_38_15]|uniref:Glycosyl transferase family 1 domain-containing protein n=1 Tax=candidate division WWE3 bacterium RIFCSPHIGHO2_02_FULL_38_14 TaxID=1802620 RepID=A0A1F4VAA7_UNCKA|nr:MAG: hypothetical protein A2793_03830 [candidate division WWE3 bacterium RIFCSPHIGHO2_01_FULL_38_45]OGC49146.1 MAG: hypothetical protein A3F07_00970 [candidate division WWE3 bacterium RIFCSPHIGHO2_12_FULL_38_15]OGC52588.1 MAG: hypothetical protein A3B64_03435 [candidate division WWE3 bacterium RIFCSPLOWO2_01_FULL_37_24]OGC54079.1 MAG: hypothetical protein A3D91_04960 [candidate division WWE3 bacterium RIFCSPHIGHO2_02_FULL_38_14]HLB51749.1 glycosyltransferase family 1 protein [Patescibacteria